eukprot:UN13657
MIIIWSIGHDKWCLFVQTSIYNHHVTNCQPLIVNDYYGDLAQLDLTLIFLLLVGFLLIICLLL